MLPKKCKLWPDALKQEDIHQPAQNKAMDYQTHQRRWEWYLNLRTQHTLKEATWMVGQKGNDLTVIYVTFLLKQIVLQTSCSGAKTINKNTTKVFSGGMPYSLRIFFWEAHTHALRCVFSGLPPTPLYKPSLKYLYWTAAVVNIMSKHVLNHL